MRLTLLYAAARRCLSFSSMVIISCSPELPLLPIRTATEQRLLQKRTSRRAARHIGGCCASI